MLSIRLRRTGAKKNAHYRVVVADSRAARDGAFIEVLGHYHPRYEPAKVVLDVEKIKTWIDKGAQPSDTVKSLMKKVESGAVETEQLVAPSRHRDTVKHAEIRATAAEAEPEPEPEVEVAVVEEDAGEKAAAEAVVEESSDDAAVEAVAEESSEDAALEAVAEESLDAAAAAPESGDEEATAEEDDEQDKE